MQLFTVAISLAFALLGAVMADDAVAEGHIKVYLFAHPAFISEVQVDAYNTTCVSLRNNLIDGKVQSLLVGGHDVVSVLNRKDYWWCIFYDNYDCAGREEDMLMFPDGVNNLRSSPWSTRIHSLQCTDR